MTVLKLQLKLRLHLKSMQMVQDGSVTISTGEQLAIAVSLTSGGYSGTDADWWVVADTPSGWQYYNLTSRCFYSRPYGDLTECAS